MFKLYNNLPNKADDIEVICDYMEYRCLMTAKKKVSIADIVREFIISADEKITSGIEDVEDGIIDKVESVVDEVARRKDSTNSRYPFELIDGGNVMTFGGFNSLHDYLYVYMLLATRLNMKDDKKHANIDGTLLFEEISADTASNYLGSKSKSRVMGTSMPGGFKKKVEQLCDLINEGSHFHNHSGGPIDENDGSLDFVSLVDFSDKKPSKLIAFGQSKTGTDWETHMSKLQPQTFCSLWFSRMPAFLPIRMYFIADIPDNRNWYKISSKGGILFDRLRILNHAPNVFDFPTAEARIKKWTNAALLSAKKASVKPVKKKKKKKKKKKTKRVARAKIA